MTTTVYFDLDGTLIDYTAPFSEIFAQTLPIETSEGMADTYFDEVLSGVEQLKEDPYRRAFEAVRQEYNLDVTPRSMAATYIENEAAVTCILPSVRQLVERIATRYQTGILTNGDGRMQRRKLQEHGLVESVDTVIVSNEVGTRKPEQEIFEKAKSRLPAETFIYVGDTFEEDIVPACEADFRTVYVGEDERSNAPITARGTKQLAGLLLPLIGEDAERSHMSR